MQENLKVLMIIPTFWPRQGGAQMVIKKIHDKLEGKAQFTVLTRKYKNTPYQEKIEDIKIHRYLNPAPEKWKDYATGTKKVKTWQIIVVAFFDTLCSIPKIVKLGKKHDAIHIHFPLPLGISAILSRFLHKKPMMTTLHGNADIYEPSKFFYRPTAFVLKRVNGISAVSQDLNDFTKENLKVKKDITTIRNGVDVDYYKPIPDLKKDNNTLRIFSICRLVPRKHVDTIVKAINLLKEQKNITNIEYYIGGTGSELGKLEKMAANNPSQIKLTGYLSEEDKIKELTLADLFVQLSTREGFSISNLEAMACETASIVTNIIGVREPIMGGNCGYLLDDPKDVEATAKILEEAVNNLDKIREMGKQARKHVIENQYTEKSMAEKYYQLYQSIT